MVDGYLLFYERLSKEDGDDESCSITNQRRILNNFVDRNDAEFKNFDIEEFIDDGYSGTNFDRPDFQRMMTRIRALNGKSIVVATKDFSRLGRDTIDTINYIEKIFPFLDVRYIAVNDDYDSQENHNGVDFETKFKNLINGIYPIQMSIDQKAIKREEALQGKHNGPIPTYGYRFTPERELEVDWEASNVVQMIVELLDQEKPYKEIISFLAEKKIETPSVYLNRVYGAKMIIRSSPGTWSRTMIARIVRNKKYLGYAVGHKTQTYIIGSKKTHVVPEEEQILVANRQPAILREEQVNRILARMEKRARKGERGDTHKRISALYKKVKCSHCGYALTRKRYTETKDYYICSEHDRNPLSTCLFERRIDTAKLEEAVYEAIKYNICLYGVAKKNAKKVMSNSFGNSSENLKKIRDEIEHLNCRNFEMHQDYCEGRISKEKYLKDKAELSKQIQNLEVQRTLMEEDITKRDKQYSLFKTEFANTVEKYKDEKELTKEMADAFIEKIFVDNSHNIEIIFRFREELNSIVNPIKIA